MYYTLVASLRELTPEGRGFDVAAAIEQVREGVSDRDARIVDLLCHRPENREQWEEWYDQCAASGNDFLKNWAAFDRDVRNVAAALTARRLGLNPAEQTVGEGYVAESIARSAAADFGLRGELDYVDRLVALMTEGGDIVEKERTVDQLRWQMADELSTFNYFDLNAVLAWLVKAEILRRWARLDPESGGEAIDNMVNQEI